jgi:hypothetical protein
MTLQRGEPRRSGQKGTGLNSQMIGLLATAVVAGTFAVYLHNQSALSSDANPLFHWLLVLFPIIAGLISMARRLGTVTHEVLTFDRSTGRFLQEGTSALGKRVIKQLPLARIVDVELIQETDEDMIYYGIKLQLSARKTHFLEWGDRQIAGKSSAINLHHHRQLAQQLRDFLLPQLVGQPLADRTQGSSLDAPLAAIAEDQQASLDQAKDLVGLLFADKATRQSQIAEIRQLLLQNPHDADANFNMALALSCQKDTQYEALPYLQRARDGYRQAGDSENRLPMIEQSIRKLEKKRR